MAALVSKKQSLKAKGSNHYHNGSKLRRLKMLSGGKDKRNARGEIIKHADFTDPTPSAAVARIEPDRKWFGNTRIITQTALDTFRNEMIKRKNDPYSILLKQSQLPTSLLNDSRISHNSKILMTESFADTFGSQSQRRRPKLNASCLEQLVSKDDVSEKTNISLSSEKSEVSEPIFSKGQSKRIWNELFKVIDSSDVLIHVLDARDPAGTRCHAIETHLARPELAHKHLVLLLNKSDLVPNKVLQQWLKKLSQERPTLAFHASLKNCFGRGALIAILRQFSRLHQDRKQISVGFIGYPNVGKSSVINALRQKAVCPVAPIPGATKVWQYISLMKRIYLIDCPGVVPVQNQKEGIACSSAISYTSDTEKVIRGAIRVENLSCPEDHIPVILRIVNHEHISNNYKVSIGDLENNEFFCTANIYAKPSHEETIRAEKFLKELSEKSGRLLKGGEADIRTTALVVINDFLRGRLPYYILPDEN